MTTLSANVASIDFGDVFRGIDAMTRRNVLAPAFKALKAPLRADQLEHADAKAGSDGGWAPRAASTLARHKYKPRLPRKLLGRLPRAVKYLASGRGVSGESLVGWSGAHQDGEVVGHGARLPKREHLWISAKMLGLAVSQLEGVVLDAFGGGS